MMNTCRYRGCLWKLVVCLSPVALPALLVPSLALANNSNPHPKSGHPLRVRPSGTAAATVPENAQIMAGDLPAPNTDAAGNTSTPSTFVVLYDQDNNFASDAQVSQNFTDAGGLNDAFDCEAADDFVVPSGQNWTISSVRVQGLYNGTGPATDVTVSIYANAGAVPGALEFSSTQVPTSGLETGSFVIGLSTPPVLAPGTHWLSIQANQPNVPAGEWGWVQRVGQNNSVFVWRNPGNGFLSGCTSFSHCGAANPDLAFSLTGSACGDGVIEGNEQCDDGNLVSGDNCSATCQIETSTPTPTSTPLPQTITPTASALLQGAVSLQGRPAPPDPRWSVPLQVSLSPQGGGPAVTCTPTTDQSGSFMCSGFPPGTYTGCVKHSHTLQNCQSVTLASGPNMANFGTLREGDANNDNCVLLVDFSTLVSTFGKCTGDAGFDARADFDLSGCAVLVDFSLLASNFSQCGATAPGPPPPLAALAARARAVGANRGGRAALAVVAPATVEVGQRFSVALQIEAGQQPVDGAAAYLNFDPRMLLVEEVTAGGQLRVQLHQQVDNAAGKVDYAAVTFANFPAGTFDFATLHFLALRGGPTVLVLNDTAPRQSDLTFGGASVLAPPRRAVVTIIPRGPHGAKPRPRSRKVGRFVAE
jgi:cysteine-rich repeat protein